MASAPTQPRRRLSKEARRAKLLAAAESVFAEVGYSGATMELVGARGGVTRSLLYEHFASIEEIYVECHRSAREEMQGRLFEAVARAGSDLEDQLRAGLTSYFAYFNDHPQRFELLYGPGGPGNVFGPVNTGVTDYVDGVPLYGHTGGHDVTQGDFSGITPWAVASTFSRRAWPTPLRNSTKPWSWGNGWSWAR